MDYKEFKVIGEAIQSTINAVNNSTVMSDKLILITDLFSWLTDNGQCVLVTEKTKRLKTQDNHIETYMAKWGIKFTITKIYKYNKSVDCRMQML